MDKLGVFLLGMLTGTLVSVIVLIAQGFAEYEKVREEHQRR